MARRKATAEKETKSTVEPGTPEPAGSAEQSVDKAESPPTAEQKSKESPPQTRGKTVKVRYDGIASRVRHAGYQFRPGQVLEIKESELEDFLTVPFERFSKVKE